MDRTAADPRTLKAKLEGAWAPLIGRRGKGRRTPCAAGDHLQVFIFILLGASCGAGAGGRTGGRCDMTHLLIYLPKTKHRTSCKTEWQEISKVVSM